MLFLLFGSMFDNLIFCVFTISLSCKGPVINKPTDRPEHIFKFFKNVSCPNKIAQKCAVPQQNFLKMCSTPTNSGPGKN